MFQKQICKKKAKNIITNKFHMYVLGYINQNNEKK